VHTDDGFREIQLNGKQLVFLFMAATVVLVVSFLCGVLVGPDVKSGQQAPVETTATVVVPDPVTPPVAQASATPSQPPAEPPAPAEELTYYDRLQKNNTPPETLKPSSPPPKAVSPAPQKSTSPATPARQTSPSDAHSGAPSAGEPPGPGLAVQVTTQPNRQAADTLAKQLIKKGYPAYVAGPVPSGDRSIYRVRVGKYKTAKEAEAIKTKLEVEEHFKPWIAR